MTSKKSQLNPAKKHNLPTLMRPKLILVEGNDEYEFFMFLRLKKDIQIHVYEGKNQLRLVLETIKNVEGFDNLRRVAIVRDADSDPEASLQSVLQQWAHAFQTVKPKVTSDTWFGDAAGREWCVWLMPRPDLRGDLEELLWQAVAPSEHRSCIHTFMECLNVADDTPFKTETKARLYSWLATQRDPIKELHAAFQSRLELFNPDDEAFARFSFLINEM